MTYNNKKISNGLKKILIAGEGGQGVQTISKVLLDILNTKNFQISFVPNYGVEQRGGVSMGYIQFIPPIYIAKGDRQDEGKEKIYYPKFLKADIMILLSERAFTRANDYINKDSIVIYNTDLINDPEIKKIKNAYGFAFDTLSKEIGSQRVMNMVVLGTIIKTINDCIKLEDAKKSINHKFESKYKNNSKLKEMNSNALELGYGLIK
ncbi:MAG: 2-oxoacid:acceptor oxidoreductase family protein [Patescibacteria group bacterium]|nr:2-oxoacid:acceptor oxidoreductase family protein [Patescibacteria group bacterium]